MSEAAKIIPRQDDKWDAAVASMPAMMCGRLDMHTYSGDGEHMQRFVYVAGEDERTLVQGPFCDHIAYAAQSYARVLARALTAEAEVVRLRRYATLERSYSKLCDRRAPDYSHERLMVWLDANGCDVKNGEPVGVWLARERDAALSPAKENTDGQ